VRACKGAGFSVVKYVGDGNNNSTIGHGLGAAPSFIIIKRTDGANAWDIYHVSNGAQKYMDFTTSGVGSLSTIFPTVPTSSLFYIGSTGGQNTLNGNHVAYCFAEVPSFSKFGSFTSNGVAGDGAFVYCGFAPKFLLCKRSNNLGEWYIFDAVRNTYNVIGSILNPNLDQPDNTSNFFDFLSNGFKVRAPVNALNNAGDTIIYAAFAEHPFQYARAR
jgi:hypothetical protein